MFGKGKQVARKETPLEKSDVKAFLGPGSQFEGKLAFTEIVRVDGTFRGEIISKDTLIVGQSADLQAEVNVGVLILSGKIKGNIVASSRVELRSPAQIEGNIETPALLIEDGVVLNGTVQMQVSTPEKSEKKSK